MRTKKFDCVEMKNRIQAAILADYRRSQGESASFEEYVEAEAAKSAWVRRVRARFGLVASKFK
jgi:hypothetical protein